MDGTTIAQRGAEGFWPSHEVTPARNDDVSRFKITLRDALWLLCGCLAMYGAQFAAQYGMRSDIRDLATQQRADIRDLSAQLVTMASSFQRQIDDNRKESALNRVNIEDLQKENSELKGILLGAGIKGVKQHE